MHDMWAFTGICHYSGNCLKFTENVSTVPSSLVHPFADLSALTWEQKRRYRKDGIVYVGLQQMDYRNCPSQRIIIIGSPDYMGFLIPIDTTRYYPVDRIEARTHFNLDADKIYLLFGAAKHGRT